MICKFSDSLIPDMVSMTEFRIIIDRLQFTSVTSLQLQCQCYICRLALLSYPVILSFCHPQHATQASTRHLLETSSVQSALHTVSAMEKALQSAAVRRASSGPRKILQLWLAHVSIPLTNYPLVMGHTHKEDVQGFQSSLSES